MLSKNKLVLEIIINKTVVTIRMGAVSIEELRDNLLEIVVENFDYFRKNPSHLAWAMMNYEHLSKVSYIVLKDEAKTPKEGVEGLEKKLSKDDFALLTDAYSAVLPDPHFSDANIMLPLDSKPNKTFNEWVELLTDEKYRYSDLYPTKKHVKNNLLCVIGTGYDWNKEGFITELGPMGTDMVIFAGYLGAEEKVAKEVRDKIVSIRRHPDINLNNLVERWFQAEIALSYVDNGWHRASEARRIVNELNEKCAELSEEVGKKLKTEIARTFFEMEQKNAFRERKIRTYYPLCEYSNLVTMPDNAHQSYVNAGIEVAKEILANKKEPYESREYARAFLDKWAKK